MSSTSAKNACSLIGERIENNNQDGNCSDSLEFVGKLFYTVNTKTQLSFHCLTLGHLNIERNPLAEKLGGAKLLLSIQHFIQQCSQLPDCGRDSLVPPVCEKLWRSKIFGSSKAKTGRKHEDQGQTKYEKSSLHNSTDESREDDECHTREFRVWLFLHQAATAKVNDSNTMFMGASFNK